MLTSRRIIPITIAILCFLPGLVLGQTITGHDIKELIPEESETFTLQQVEPREDAALVKAVYVYNPLDVEIPFFLAYNNDSEKVKEYSTDYYSSEGFTYGADNSDLEKKLDEGETGYSIQMDLQDGLGEKILSWEMEHGTLRDEYPITQLLPLNAAPFALSNIRNKTSSLVNASYDHPEMEQSVQLRLYHGERARQEYELAKCEWDDKESVQFEDETFYGTAGESGMSITSYVDNFFIDLVLRDRTDDPDTQQIEQQMGKFVESLEINRLSDWKAPESEASDVHLSEEYFADILPEETEHFALQNIESKEEGSLLEANYLYKPEEHEVTLNLVYREGTELLAGRKQSVGNFRANVIPHCLESKTSAQNPSQLFDELYDNIDESGLAEWEIDHANLQEMNPLAAYFPKNVGDFSIRSIRPDDEDPTVNAKYRGASKEDPINVLVTYGDDAARKYNRLQLSIFDNELTTIEVNDTSFDVLEEDDQIIAFQYNYHLLITAGYSDYNQENKEVLYQQLTNFLSTFQPNKLADFEAPDDYEMNFTGEQDGTKLCLGLECFDEYISKCEPAKFGGRMSYRLGVMYSIEEPAGDNQCKLSLEYTHNPNSDWEEKPLYFQMDRDDSFLESGRNIIENCLEGNTDEFNCEGPLLDEISE